jgi:hypothetical protein
LARTGGSCAAGSYCAPLGGNLCAPSAVTVCPATPCNADQICAGGLCSTPPPIGYCSDGSAGSLCHGPSDCDSGLNCNALGTAIGTCG